MKPVGSGWFSLALGVVFILIAFQIWTDRWHVSDINPNRLLTVWMIFSGVIMAIWGIGRIATTTNKSPMVGQATLNFCVAIIGATIAILAILIK